jgi:hypothetical protein
MDTTQVIDKTPDGYMQNAAGHLVPVELVDEIAIMRDALVREMIKGAQQLQAQIATFKERWAGDFQAFLQLSAEKYSVAYGGDKGNVTLSSFDGRYRVMFVMADHMEFDERLHIAKAMLDKCILRWGEGVNAQYRALVMNAFQVDKKGKINTTRVLEMTRWDIDDEEWKGAMKAIRDSVFISGTKSYMRFYERPRGSQQFKQISLDFSAL